MHRYQVFGEIKVEREYHDEEWVNFTTTTPPLPTKFSAEMYVEGKLNLEEVCIYIEKTLMIID